MQRRLQLSRLHTEIEQVSSFVALAALLAAMAAEPRDSVDGGKNRWASPDHAPHRRLAGEHVLSAYSGFSHTVPSDVTITRPDGASQTLKAVPWQGQSFKSPIYYGFRLAHWFGRLPLGLMLDFTHAKAIAEREAEVKVLKARKGDAAAPGSTPERPAAVRQRITQLFKKLEFSHGHNLLLLNGLLRLPFASLRLSPYIGIGAGVAVPHVEVRERGLERRTYSYQLAGPAVQMLAGVELRFKQTSLFIEWKLSYSPHRARLEDERGGALETALTTMHVIGGWSLRAMRTPVAGP